MICRTSTCMEIQTAAREWGFFHLTMGDEDSAYVADWLFEEEEIAVRSGAHCAPLMHETLGTKMQGAVRISVSHKNTEEEIDRTANAVKKLSQLLDKGESI